MLRKSGQLVLHWSDNVVPGLIRHSLLARTIQPRQKASTELLHFRERVRFAAFVADSQNDTFLHMDHVGFEIPVGIGTTFRRVVEQLGQRRAGAERNVRAKVENDCPGFVT